MTRGFRPGKAAPYRYGALLVAAQRPERAVTTPFKRQRSGVRCRCESSHTASFLLKLQLQLVQMPVLPVRFSEQLGVRSVLDQPAILDHEQTRRFPQRRQPV